MATPYSNPNLYFQMSPVDPTNWDLAFKSLQYKQGQYDTNKLKVDSLIQQYLSTDILKAEVKDKFAQNINNLIGEINATGRTDFSDSNITSRVMSHIGQALDESTLNAIAVSKQVRQQEGFLQDLQQKKPELYSNINHQDMYRKKGNDGKSLNDWLNDGDANSIFRGNLQYQPFVDVDKRVNDVVMNLMKQNGNTEIELPDPTDPTGIRTIKSKISGLNENQLRQIVQYSMTSPEDQGQLSLNARAKYNWYETPQDIERLRQDTEDLINPQLSAIDGKISEIELALSKTTPESQDYSKLTQELQQYKDNKAYNNQLATNLEKSLSQEQFDVAASQVYNLGFSEATVRKFLPLYKEQFLGFGVDEYGKDRRDHEFALQKERTRQQELADKIQRDAAEKQATAQGQLLVVDNVNNLTEMDSLETALNTERQALSLTATTTSKQYLQSLVDIQNAGFASDGQKFTEANLIFGSYRARIQGDLEAKGDKQAYKKLQGKSMTELMEEFDPNATIFSETIDYLGGVELKTSISQDGATNYASVIKKASSDFVYASKEMDRIEQMAKKELEESDGASGLQAISENDYQLFVETRNGGFGVIPAKELLKTNDVLDANGNPIQGKKLSDSKHKTHIERTFLAGQIMRDPAITIRNGEYPSGQREKIERIAASFGEANAILPNNTGSEMWGETIGGIFKSIDPVVVDPNSKTGKYLQFVKDNYRDNKLFWQDNVSLAGDGSFARNYYGNKDFRQTETYRRELERLHGNLPSSKAIGVDTKTPDGTRLIQLANTKQGAEGIGEINAELPIILNRVDENTYNLSQKQTVDKETTTVNLGNFSRQEIERNFPQFVQRINWEQDKVRYNRQTMQGQPIQTKPIKYWTSYTPVENANEIVGNDPELRALLKGEDAYAYITQFDPNIVGMANTVDRQLPQKLLNAINNSTNYRIQANVENRGLGDFVTLGIYDKNTNSLLYQDKYEGMDNLDNIKSILDQTPQILYTQMLQKIIAENYNRNITNPMFQLNGQANYTEAYKNIFK